MIEQKAESMSTEAIPGSGDYDAGRHGRVPFASAVVLGFPLDLDLDDLREGGAGRRDGTGRVAGRARRPGLRSGHPAGAVR